MRNRSLAWVFVLAVTTLSGAGESSAQVFTPSYHTASEGHSIGGYLSDGPAEFALEGIYREAAGGIVYGGRAMFAVPAEGVDPTGALGADLIVPISSGGMLNLAATAAAQGALGGLVGAGARVGVVAGGVFDLGGLLAYPYVQPTFGFRDIQAAELKTDLEYETGAGLEVGARLDFDQWSLDGTGTFGATSLVGVGLRRRF